MVENANLNVKDIIKDQFERIDPAETDSKEIKQNDQSEVILFFSFDIVNSSQYKKINYFDWAKVLTRLFKEIQKRVKSDILESELWRVLGDEAIFIVRIKSIDSLHKYIEIIYNILLASINDLKTGSFFGNIECISTREKKLMQRQNILSLKSAAWIAEVANIENADEMNVENLFEEYDLDSKNKFYEFLGNDIDAGFRISKYTIDSRLVLSFELAMLLSKRTESLQCLNIITYKSLKGIWNGRYYPIIWYHNDKICKKSFKDSFAFDESVYQELVKEYFNNRKGNAIGINPEMDMFDDVYNALLKVLRDRGLEGKIEKIEKTIEKTDSRTVVYLQSPTLELHCAVICYDPDTKKILIAKRNQKREREPGKWEFGCAKARKDKDLCEGIIEEYKDDFHIDIELVMQKKRDDEEPIPLAVYQLDNAKDLHKGIIFLAKVKNINDMSSRNLKKHSEFRWIGRDEIEEFSHSCVKDFCNSLQLAFDKIDELEEKKDGN